MTSTSTSNTPATAGAAALVLMLCHFASVKVAVESAVMMGSGSVGHRPQQARTLYAFVPSKMVAAEEVVNPHRSRIHGYVIARFGSIIPPSPRRGPWRHHLRSSNRRVLQQWIPISYVYSSFDVPAMTSTSMEHHDFDIPITILFENDHVLVIDKPAGISHHDDAGYINHVKNGIIDDSSSSSSDDEDNSIPVDGQGGDDGDDVGFGRDGETFERSGRDSSAKADTVLTGAGVLTRLRELQRTGSIPYRGRLYGVHRLDRVTSGILMFAKDPRTAGLLGRAFRERRVTKYYVALSGKKRRKRKQGWVRGDMVRSRRGTWMLTRSTDDPAVTRFFTCGLGDVVVPPYGHDEDDDSSSDVAPRTMILFRPYTGRTHQLRVAAKGVGLPILGDRSYGGGQGRRTYLHACALHVDLDDIGIAGGGNVTVVSPPPFFLVDEEDGTTGRPTAVAGQGSDVSGGRSGSLDLAFREMIRKHCKDECRPIVDRMGVED